MKMKLLALICCSVFSAGIAGRGLAQDSGLPSLIVAPFSGNTTTIQYWQPALGEGLSEMLITELAKINKFQVLETTQLEVLKDEIKLGQDGWVEPSEKVEKGGFAGADFMFTAKVTQFGHKESKIGLGGFVPGNLGNLGLKQTVSNVRIDWRLVDATNRKIIKAGSAAGEKKGTGFNVGVNITGHGGGIGLDNKEFMDSALGKATVMALSQITDELKPTPLPESARHKSKATQAGNALAAISGKVLAVASRDAIIISIGSKQGLKDGDKLKLYETSDIKDDKGAVVFTEEKLVGEVTIQSVQEDRSKATYSGDREVKAGWAVKAK
jgi:curli biogenesis system outer membrane secretion channel CsgG